MNMEKASIEKLKSFTIDGQPLAVTFIETLQVK